MRIGIVVDSACDLPADFIREHRLILLPITVRIGEAVLADHREEDATLNFLDTHVAERGAEAETIPFSVNQIRDLFLQHLVIDYDHVFCLTITKTRSPIHDNALQASFAILNEYRPIRQAAGEPGFLAGVLQFILAHEPTLMRFAEETGTPPAAVGRALRALPLGDGNHERSI